MTKEELKQYIDQNIYENVDGDISGDSLNKILKAIVDDGGTEVEANPTGEATTPLNKIKIGETNYNIPQTDTSNLATKQELQQGLSGKQDTISASAKISSDFVDDTDKTNKFVTSTEKGLISTAIQGVKKGTETLTPVDGVVTVPSDIEGAQATSVPSNQSATATIDSNHVLQLGIPRGADAVNPFKGWYASANTLPANPVVGDYAYVKGANASDPVAIYECTTAGTWSDSGRTADTSNVQTFASGEEVNEISIDNDFVGGSDKIAGADEVKTIVETTMELVESENLLNPADIDTTNRINRSGSLKTIGDHTDVYGCTDYIPIGDEGLTANHCPIINATLYCAACVYDENKLFIGYTGVLHNGDAIYISKGMSFSGTPAEGADTENPYYVRFNFYNPASVEGGVAYDGVTDGYAIYKGNQAGKQFVRWFTPYLADKRQQFGSGEKIDEVMIDNTSLVNPSANALAKAVDVKNVVDGINAKISEIDYSETNVELISSGDNQNLFPGYVNYKFGWRTNPNYKFLLLPLNGIDRIEFLGENVNNTQGVGFIVGTFSGEPNSTLDNFTIIKGIKYTQESDVEGTYREYEYVVDKSIDNLYAAISIHKGNTGFYCKAISGNTLDDIINEKIGTETITAYTSTSNVGNCIIQAAKEHTFADGTPPLYEWFLLEDTEGHFYYSKDLQTKLHIFDFDGAVAYRFGILANGDIVAVRLAETLAGDTQSDANRVNPYVFLASENWATRYEVDFGEYVPPVGEGLGTGLKPCGWLANKGFRNLPDGTTVFGEYTRPTVEHSLVWKIDGNPLNSANWTVIKEFSPIGSSGTNVYKHVHCIAYDHYTGVLYCTTGDVDAYAQIWYSTDNGASWTQIEKNASLNNGQQYRLCMMTFTTDYIVWGTDTPSPTKHCVYRGERDANGILDKDTIVLLCGFTEQLGQFSAYGQAYLQEYDAILLFDRQDGGADTVHEMPLWVVEVQTGTKHQVALLKQAKYNEDLGFRCKFKEWYPIDGIIRVGFGFDDYTSNYNAVCGNGIRTSSSHGKTTVNNLGICVKKDGDNWTCRFSTYYV